MYLVTEDRATRPEEGWCINSVNIFTMTTICVEKGDAVAVYWRHQVTGGCCTKCQPKIGPSELALPAGSVPVVPPPLTFTFLPSNWQRLVTQAWLKRSWTPVDPGTTFIGVQMKLGVVEVHCPSLVFWTSDAVYSKQTYPTVTWKQDWAYSWTLGPDVVVTQLVTYGSATNWSQHRNCPSCLYGSLVSISSIH